MPGLGSANLTLLFLQLCMNLHRLNEAYDIALGSSWLLVNHLTVQNSLRRVVQGWDRALCTSQTRHSDPPGTLTWVFSPKAFTAMAPPAPNSARQDANILQPVKEPRVLVCPSNVWVDFKIC